MLDTTRKTNLAVVKDIVFRFSFHGMSIKDLDKAIKQYVYDWMGVDQYYIDYKVETTVICGKENDVSLLISLAYIDEA